MRRGAGNRRVRSDVRARMNPDQPFDDADEQPASVDLSAREQEDVERRRGAAARVVHEVIRQQGDEELRRPALSLMWSGIAGGIAISASLVGKSAMQTYLPDAEWRPLVASLGYSLGFLIVVLGRLQLFTESTLSAVIPIATHPTPRNLVRLGRLWGIVLLSNCLGTFIVALGMRYGLIGTSTGLSAMQETAREALAHEGWTGVAAAVPAGFLMAAIAWVLPSGRRQEFWIVLFFTYFISLGGFAHVVAGSAEVWMLVLAGELTLYAGVVTHILPVLLGNILGGTVLFAMLAHAGVRQELGERGDPDGTEPPVEDAVAP